MKWLVAEKGMNSCELYEGEDIAYWTVNAQSG